MKTTNKTSKKLHITLWIIQFLLASMFILAGYSKSFQEISTLSQMIPWVTEVPSGLVRFIGMSELFGGPGLLLPAAMRIRPILTPIAAIGLSLIQFFAMIFHIMHNEFNMLGMNSILLLLAIFIAWGRLKLTPIEPK